MESLILIYSTFRSLNFTMQDFRSNKNNNSDIFQKQKWSNKGSHFDTTDSSSLSSPVAMTTWCDYKERAVSLCGSHLLRISARPLNLYHKIHHPVPPLPSLTIIPESSRFIRDAVLIPTLQHADLHKCEMRRKGPGSEPASGWIRPGLQEDCGRCVLLWETREEDVTAPTPFRPHLSRPNYPCILAVPLVLFGEERIIRTDTCPVSPETWSSCKALNKAKI